MTDTWRLAAEALTDGGVVLVPTDTVYGIAALASRPDAVRRLYELKERPEGVPIAVLVADLTQAAAIGRFSAADRAVAQGLWPGALTLVVPAATPLEFAADDGTIGVRCPAHDSLRSLAETVGPLATTSANRHGELTPPSAEAAARSLNGEIDVIIDTGPCAGVASTVATVGPPVVVHREGQVTMACIQERIRSGIESDDRLGS